VLLIAGCDNFTADSPHKLYSKETPKSIITASTVGMSFAASVAICCTTLSRNELNADGTTGGKLSATAFLEKASKEGARIIRPLLGGPNPSLPTTNIYPRPPKRKVSQRRVNPVMSNDEQAECVAGTWIRVGEQAIAASEDGRFFGFVGKHQIWKVLLQLAVDHPSNEFSTDGMGSMNKTNRDVSDTGNEQCYRIQVLKGGTMVTSFAAGTTAHGGQIGGPDLVLPHVIKQACLIKRIALELVELDSSGKEIVLKLNIDKLNNELKALQDGNN